MAPQPINGLVHDEISRRFERALWLGRSLVAVPLSRDLLLCAKHLLVEAICSCCPRIGQHEDARRHTAMPQRARPLWRHSLRAGGGSERLPMSLRTLPAGFIAPCPTHCLPAACGFTKSSTMASASLPARTANA